jgi:hypothetical protein
VSSSDCVKASYFSDKLCLASRRSSVNAESLDTYRNLVKNATEDLEAHLQSVDEKLETIFGHAATGSSSDAKELRLIQEEQKSTQQCLQICAQLSKHIDQIQLVSDRGDISAGRTEPGSVPGRLIINGLQECKDRVIKRVSLDPKISL